MSNDIYDLTPEDAFGICPQERAELDRVHVNLLRRRNALPEPADGSAEAFRLGCYSFLTSAESPRQLEEAGQIVITDFGYRTDGRHRMLEWRRPRLLAWVVYARLAMQHGGDLEDGEGIYYVERDILLPTQLTAGEWYTLWYRMQEFVLLDQQLQRIEIASAAA
jgi:ribosomal protein L24E